MLSTKELLEKTNFTRDELLDHLVCVAQCYALYLDFDKEVKENLLVLDCSVPEYIEDFKKLYKKDN